jgi:hypothetical protein
MLILYCWAKSRNILESLDYYHIIHIKS